MPTALRLLKAQRIVEYRHVTRVHKILFQSVYPWAGEDRLATALGIAIAKAGFNTMFSHPKDVQRATDHALSKGQDVAYFSAHPGAVHADWAYAHPFLEGNGRTVLTVYAELARRADFHVRWEEISTHEFLATLTSGLLHPHGRLMDSRVQQYVTQGALSMAAAAKKLEVNFNRSV